MAKSAAIPYAILLLIAVGMIVPSASAFDILKCWKAVVEVENCVVKLIPSFLSLHIKLTKECCKAFVDIEESCLPAALITAPLLGPGLTNFTSSVCGAFAVPPSSPALA